MKLCYRLSLNFSNTVAVALGIWILYQANQGHIKLALAPEVDYRNDLDRMCFAVAIFAVFSTVTNLIGSVIVNIDSDILTFFYCVVLGGFAGTFLALTVVTLELLDEFEDAIVYELYEAIVHFNRSAKASEFLDKVQKDLKCCGAEGATHFRNGSLPESCCPDVLGNSTRCTNSTAFEDTCELKVTYSIETNAQWIVFAMLFMAGYFCILIGLESFVGREEAASST